MNVDKLLIRIAGSFVLVSVLLAHFHSPYWLWLTGFVGANLVQASFTGFCPMVRVLKALGVKPGKAFE